MTRPPWGFLLDQAVFTVRGAPSHIGTLPDVLAWLGHDEVEAFTGLQFFQEHAWHAFLVQLAATALHRAGQKEPVQTTEAWRGMLLALSDNQVEPWSLVVEDLSQAAFLQPPVPEKSLAKWKEPLRFPDELDILVTAKNFEVKGARIANPQAEHWAYALVSLQTMQGFLGAGNYGISRMNGGFANRPGVGFSPSLRWGARFVRDVRTLLAARKELLKEHGFDDGGPALLWLETWDGTTSLPLTSLDPFYIEVCRRVRAVFEGDRLAVRPTSTKAPRVDAKEVTGNTGDIWTPVARESNKALTVASSGFNYKLAQALLLGATFEPGHALRTKQDRESSLIFLASALARGQGKTEGYHRRTIEVPRDRMAYIENPAKRLVLAQRAAAWVEVAGKGQREVLNRALCVLLQGAPDSVDFRDRRADRWVDAHDREVDRLFFEQLWRDAELDETTALTNWHRTVHDLAQAQLDDAIASVPLPAVRRYEVIAAAEASFRGNARKTFPNLYPSREAPPAEELSA